MANPSCRSAPLYVIKKSDTQDAASPGTEVTSYFDISTQHDGSSAGRSPASPSDISPGSPPRFARLSATRRPHFRFHSDYGTLHEKIHGYTIQEDQSREGLKSPATGSTPSPGSPTTKIPSVQPFERPPRRTSLHSSESSAQSSAVLVSRSSRDFHTFPQYRPKLSLNWGRPLSSASAVEPRTTGKDSAHRRSSTLSESVTGDGNVIHVRTDQTPLKPPQPKRSVASRRTNASSIKIETEFTELDRTHHASPEISTSKQVAEAKIHSSAQRAHRKTRSSERPRRSSSPRSSINAKHILSAPLQLLRRLSLPKRSAPLAVSTTSIPSPARQATRLPDHRTTQLKRNYTAEALQRATAALQDLRATSPTSLLSPHMDKPSKWKTFPDKPVLPKTKKEPKTVQGIISGLANRSHTGSYEQPSDVPSYTSSQREISQAAVPTNTPDEIATYKIKRSPSANTEEFLKIDISIRGGTSYLPSEARRIHTPPLPEEGANGRWKGFFFDYNAPRRSSLQVPQLVLEGVVDGGPSKLDSIMPSDLNQNGPMPHGRPKLERSKTKNKRVLTGDWIDVKLAKIDSLGKDVAADNNQISREGTQYLSSPDAMSKNGVKMMHEGKEVKPALFDMTIPEHLLSSPLCPRHARYWRVMKGKGSQFRGCWMHGVGVYEDVSV